MKFFFACHFLLAHCNTEKNIPGVQQKAKYIEIMLLALQNHQPLVFTDKLYCNETCLQWLGAMPHLNQDNVLLVQTSSVSYINFSGTRSYIAQQDSIAIILPIVETCKTSREIFL